MRLPIKGLSYLASVNAARLASAKTGPTSQGVPGPPTSVVCPVSRYYSLPVGQEGGCVLTRCYYGLARATMAPGTVTVVYVIEEFGWNQRHHAEPRQQVNALVALRPFDNTHDDWLDLVAAVPAMRRATRSGWGGTQCAAALRRTFAHGVG